MKDGTTIGDRSVLAGKSSADSGTGEVTVLPLSSLQKVASELASAVKKATQFLHQYHWSSLTHTNTNHTRKSTQFSLSIPTLCTYCNSPRIFSKDSKVWIILTLNNQHFKNGTVCLRTEQFENVGISSNADTPNPNHLKLIQIGWCIQTTLNNHDDLGIPH
jgi:hypothetical protein